MMYMVLCMHSVALFLSCLFINLRKNLVWSVKGTHFLVYYTYETKEHFCLLWEVLDHAYPHLTSYIITQLHPFSLEKLELLIFFSCEVAWNCGIFWATALTLGQWKNIFSSRNCFIKFNSKNQYRAGKGWRDKHLCHNLDTGGYRLSQVFWEHENLSGLSIIWFIQLL